MACWIDGEPACLACLPARGHVAWFSASQRSPTIYAQHRVQPKKMMNAHRYSVSCGTVGRLQRTAADYYNSATWN